jgi:Tol biopolymer transport system component
MLRVLRWVCLLVLLLPALTAQAATESFPGRLLFISGGDLWLLDANGPRQLATGGTFSQPSWAPDGASLAYVYRGTNFADIFITDDQGQSQTRLTNSQSTILDNNDWNLRPTFSPDGQFIAFVSDRTTALPTLWLMNAADGSGRHALAAPGLQQDDVDALAWSPDGSQLAVTLFNEPGPTEIALVPMNSTPGNRQLSQVISSLPPGSFDPSWSPDGSWLAFAAHDGASVEIYAAQADGSAVTRLTSDGLLARSPAWSPDGGHIAYLANKTGDFEIFEIDVTQDSRGALVASTPRQVTRDLHVDATSGLSWGR